MSDEIKKRRSPIMSIRLTEEVQEEFERLRDEQGFDTVNQFVEDLLLRYSSPIRVNKDNEAKIHVLENTVGDMTKEIESLKSMIEKEKSINEAQQAENRKLSDQIEDLSKVNMQQAGRLDELDGLQHKMDGHILVPVNELDMRCLEWLAARENRQRKREDITPAVFFQYAVREMLIKGNKFAIDSVPDSVIATFKKEISHGQ